MTHIKNEFEISQEFIASTTSDDLKIHLEAKITQEIVSHMLDSIQSGSYVSIEPHEEGYTMGIDLLMIDNNELQDAIGFVIGRMFECIPIYEMGAELAQFIMAPLTFSEEEIEKECQAPFIKKMSASNLSGLNGFNNFLASIDLARQSADAVAVVDVVDVIDNLMMDKEPQQEPTNVEGE